MKNTHYIIIGLALLVLGFFLFGGKGDEQIPAGNKVDTKQSTPSGLQAKTDAQGPISITVTPLSLGKEVAEWKFNIVFTTHSGSLDQDPMTVARLIDDKGNSIAPTRWEGAGPGGHHREGVLVFKSASPTSASVRLQIKDVGGIPERTFAWDLP